MDNDFLKISLHSPQLFLPYRSSGVPGPGISE